MNPFANHRRTSAEFRRFNTFDRKRSLPSRSQDEIAVGEVVNKLVMVVDQMEQYEERLEKIARLQKNQDYTQLNALFARPKRDKKTVVNTPALRRSSKRLSKEAASRAPNDSTSSESETPTRTPSPVTEGAPSTPYGTKWQPADSNGISTTPATPQVICR